MALKGGACCAVRCLWWCGRQLQYCCLMGRTEGPVLDHIQHLRMSDEAVCPQFMQLLSQECNNQPLRSWLLFVCWPWVVVGVLVPLCVCFSIPWVVLIVAYLQKHTGQTVSLQTCILCDLVDRSCDVSVPSRLFFSTSARVVYAAACNSCCKSC